MNKLTTICIIVVMAFGVVTRASTQTEEEIRAMMAAMNEQLEAMGENVRIAAVEYYTAWEKVGQTVYFDDRTLWSGHHFVPGDPMRHEGYDITWLSDQVDGTANGVTPGDTQAAIDRAMATWDGVTCSTILLTQLPDFDMDWGNVQSLLGFGGISPSPPPPFIWYADITHAGWLPGDFFDILDPDPEQPGSTYILGVMFTFIWVDSGGEPTDIDNNRKLDVAFRETYYNNDIPGGWDIDPEWPIIDVETVVLHETGHGLSLDHFGKFLKTDKNGKFHFAPRAVMNAGYTRVQQDLTGTDLAGYCSIWGAWPYN